MDKKAERAFAATGAAIWACWFVLGVLNLYRGNISRVAYGTCWFIALWHIALYYWSVWERWAMAARKDRVIYGLLKQLKEEEEEQAAQE